MIYKTLGKTGINASVLGFGTLRLPGMIDDPSVVDIDKSVEIMREAFSLGVNYVDTAYSYRNGESEVAVGKAIKDRRNQIILATKMKPDGKKSGDLICALEKQLKRMDTDYIDIYHFHAISKNIFDNSIIPQGFLKEALKVKEQGLIKHIAFSFHDEAENMRYIIDRAEIMEAVVCQYNIIRRENEQAMQYAKEKGLGITIMGPLGGGRFKLHNADTADLALRFVLSNPNVDIVLSGMRTIDDVRENTKIVSSFEPLNDTDKSALEQIVNRNQISSDYYCTECRYCMPCPAGIDIPRIFLILNYYKTDGLLEYARMRFSDIGTVQGKGEHPSSCSDCGVCEKKCPQKLEIRKQFKYAIHVLGNEASDEGTA